MPRGKTKSMNERGPDISAEAGKPPKLGSRALLRDLREHMGDLVVQRNSLTRQIEAIESAMAAMTGAPAPAAHTNSMAAAEAPRRPGRPRLGRPPADGGRRGPTLKEHIMKVLEASGQPMAVKDIADQVLQNGFTTRSTMLAHSVGMTLKKMNNVSKVDRGVWKAK